MAENNGLAKVGTLRIEYTHGFVQVGTLRICVRGTKFVEENSHFQNVRNFAFFDMPAHAR